MKKLLKTWMIAATSLPVAAIISCSDSATTENSLDTEKKLDTLVKTGKKNVDSAFTQAEKITARSNTLKLVFIPDSQSQAGGSQSNEEVELFNKDQWIQSVRLMSKITKEVVQEDPNKVGVDSTGKKVGIKAKDLIEKFDNNGYSMIQVVIKSLTANPGWKQYGLVVKKEKVQELSQKLTRFNGKTVAQAFEKMFKSITNEATTTASPGSSGWDIGDTISVEVTTLKANEDNLGFREWNTNDVKSFLFELELLDPVVNQTYGILTRFSNFKMGSGIENLSNSNNMSGAGSVIASSNDDNVGKYSWS